MTLQQPATDSFESQRYDVIIIGAGTAGCVLAGRLSEMPSVRVLLIEAGPDAPPGSEHRDILDPYPVALANPRFIWRDLLASTGAARGDGSARQFTPFLQACCVGGGSNINGMFAERGFPADYDEWHDLGAEGWRWSDVAPYFKKLEHDMHFTGPLHGKDGPIPINSLDSAQWSAFATALASALRAKGVPMLADAAVEHTDGVSPAATNCVDDHRVSASMAYLSDEIRRRPNLHIVTEARVERIVFRERAVHGVELRTVRGLQTLTAHQVIVSCGAIFSPALLLRSGIGPAEQLNALGIPVIQALSGVGRNLQNHPTVPLVMHLRRAGMQPRHQRTWPQNVFRYTSQVSDCVDHDMEMIPMNRAAWHPLGRRVATLLVIVNRPYSKGSVELNSPNAAHSPVVRFNLLDDRRDFDRLVDGVRLAAQVLSSAEVTRLRNEAFLPNGNMVGRLAQRTRRNWLEASLISLALQIGPVRRAGLRNSTLDLQSLARDESALHELVRNLAQAAYHPCGTCKMGSADDREAVVDASGRVFGVVGLRVIDASVFPVIPRAGTHIPVIMVAEAMADRIKSVWRAEV